MIYTRNHGKPRTFYRYLGPVGVLRRLGLAGADDGAEGDEVRL